MTALRPLSPGEILDRAVLLYRRNFFPVTGLAALYGIGVVAFLFWGRFSLYLVFFLLGPWVGCLIHGSLIFYFSSAYLEQTVDVWIALGKGWQTYRHLLLPCFGHMVVTPISVFACLVISVAMAVEPKFIIYILPFLIFAFGISLYVLPKYSLAMPVAVLEGTGSFRVRRSSVLAKGHRRRLMVVIFPLVLFVWTFPFLFSLLPVFIGSSLSLSKFAISLLQNVALLVSSLFTLPVHMSVLVVMYYDMRIRQEGLDLMLEMGLSENETL